MLAIKGIASNEKVSIAKIADLLLLEQDAAKQLCEEATNRHLINQQDGQITITIQGEELLNEVFLKDEFGVAQMQKKFNKLFQ